MLHEYKAWRQFGSATALKLVVLSLRRPAAFKRQTIYTYLDKLFANIPIEDTAPQTNKAKIIWTMWWQGKEQAPELVQKCFSLFEKNKPEGYVINIIDQNNWKNYITLPQHIIDHFNNGRITITHFSDIMRANLLNTHGGVWLDSTILTSNPLPESLLQSEFFSLGVPLTEDYISLGKWGGFALGSSKGSPLVKFTTQCLDYYWQRHDMIIDYFLIDYIIRIAYERNARIHQLIDEQSYFTDKLYIVQKALTSESHANLDQVLKSNIFHKLTWKNLTPNSPALKQILAY